MLPGLKTYITGGALILYGVVKLGFGAEEMPGDPAEMIGMGFGMIFLRAGIKKAEV